MSFGMFGEELLPLEVLEMSYPMRCARCQHIHDVANVTVVSRYSDCTTWRCPNCKSLIDDRPMGWGGSAIPIQKGEKR